MDKNISLHRNFNICLFQYLLKKIVAPSISYILKTKNRHSAVWELHLVEVGFWPLYSSQMFCCATTSVGIPRQMQRLQHGI